MGSTRAALWALVAMAAMVVGCEPEYEEADPPFRTLIYTETPGYNPDEAVALEEHLLEVFEERGVIPTAAESALMGADGEGGAQGPTGEEALDLLMPAVEGEGEGEEGGERVGGEAEGVQFLSPEALGEATFRAMASQDEALFDQVLIGTKGLMALARIKEEAASKRARALRKSAAPAYGVFASVNPSEEPHGGLGSVLVLREVKIGKAGTIWGKAPEVEEEVVQHWGNQLTFGVKAAEGSEVEGELNFTIGLGRMLKTPWGWRLAAAPEVSSLLKSYLDIGFHLKPELLKPEHHAYPLSVGNFWRYRIKRPVEDQPEGAEAEVEEIRVEVTDVARFAGYRIVTMARVRKHKGGSTSDTMRYLVTARRLYTCSSYCYYKGKDLSYMLGYARTQTPILIFPLKEGASWTTGGVSATSNAVYLTRDKAELVTVPAGEFNDALVVAGKRESSYVTRYFKPGVGIVQRVVRSPTDTRVEELLEYRILTTE